MREQVRRVLSVIRPMRHPYLRRDIVVKVLSVGGITKLRMIGRGVSMDVLPIDAAEPRVSLHIQH
jgi:hypothetical protein